MDKPKLLVKRLENNLDLPLPEYKTASAAGLDLPAAVSQDLTLEPGAHAMVPTGLAVALPSNCEAQIRPRSGLAAKHGISVLNSPGTIDADYRGEIRVILINLGREPFIVSRGMRVAQMIITPVYQIDVLEVEKLEKTARGTSGFGSTGF